MIKKKKITNKTLQNLNTANHKAAITNKQRQDKIQEKVNLVKWIKENNILGKSIPSEDTLAESW